jgi:hypothetical protein
MANDIMQARDAISGSMATCYIYINGRRVPAMTAISLEAKIEKTKAEVPILGKTGKGNKSTGWKGTGSATFHYNTPMFRGLLRGYKWKGIDTYFDIQVVNEDPTSAAGRQEVMIKGCNIDGGILAKFDADADYLEEDVDFTFEDFEIVEKFNGEQIVASFTE